MSGHKDNTKSDSVCMEVFREIKLLGMREILSKRFQSVHRVGPRDYFVNHYPEGIHVRLCGNFALIESNSGAV